MTWSGVIVAASESRSCLRRTPKKLHSTARITRKGPPLGRVPGLSRLRMSLYMRPR